LDNRVKYILRGSAAEHSNAGRCWRVFGGILSFPKWLERFLFGREKRTDRNVGATTAILRGR
jgi:hypothetical protein